MWYCPDIIKCPRHTREGWSHICGHLNYHVSPPHWWQLIMTSQYKMSSRHLSGTIDIGWSLSNVLGQYHLSLGHYQMSQFSCWFQGTFDIVQWYFLTLNYPMLSNSKYSYIILTTFNICIYLKAVFTCRPDKKIPNFLIQKTMWHLEAQVTLPWN